jgi:flagellar biosynthetic protein FliQ
VNDATILHLGLEAMRLALIVSAPMILASLVVGILVSLFQVATSLQDATLAFVPKILATGAALFLAGHWILGQLVDFTRRLIEGIPGYIG